jgi:hypothetical protein
MESGNCQSDSFRVPFGVLRFLQAGFFGTAACAALCAWPVLAATGVATRSAANDRITLGTTSRLNHLVLIMYLLQFLVTAAPLRCRDGTDFYRSLLPISLLHDV